MSENTAKAVSTALKKFSNPQRALHSAHYFKTGKGGYAEGDIFIGLTVPQTRTIVKIFQKLPRTTLRYAMEHFPELERKTWLHSGFTGKNL